jgi:hypothetical protein
MERYLFISVYNRKYKKGKPSKKYHHKGLGCPHHPAVGKGQFVGQSIM